MPENLHFLIVGSGSVGKRHARNLGALGCRVSCMDPRPDRVAELESEVDTIGTFTSFDDALEASEYNGVVICSPPSVHVAQSITALEAGLPVLLEKPVCPELGGAEMLAVVEAETGVPVLLGYTWRWWPPLRRVRALLADGEIGALRHVRFVMSAHLADWHPWEAYQDFFMARKDQGGGALLDESHWIDLSCWFFGLPERVFAKIERISDLQIDSDDNVDIVLEYADGLRVTLHLDLFGRPHEKSIVFSGENGTIRWTADPNQIVVGRGIDDWLPPESFDCERNDMFVSVAEEFVNVARGGAATCKLQDGIAVLRVVEASRASSRVGRVVNLSDIG